MKFIKGTRTMTKDEARKRLHTNLLKMIQADATGNETEWTDAVRDLFKMIDDIYQEKSLINS